MISSKLIHTFIANFNYLNAKDKRTSLFSCFFNKALTHNLEVNAKDLRDALHQIDRDQKQEESKKFKEVVSSIRNAYVQCKKLREMHVPWKHYHHEKYIGAHRDCTTSGTSYDYKIPCKPSKFEKELMLALEASIRFLDEQLKLSFDENVLQIKKECCTLLYDISHFKPIEIRKNIHAWAP